jgi:hypothetical protein
MLIRAGKAALVATIVLGSAALGFADSGSNGLTTFKLKQTTTRSFTSSFLVSNVSSRDVQVTLKLYDQNGNPIGTGGFTPVVTIEGAGTSCNPSNTTCTLAAGKSTAFHVAPAVVGNDWFGHGAIEWSSSVDDTQTTALVGSASTTITPTVSGDQIVIPITFTRPMPF